MLTESEAWPVVVLADHVGEASAAWYRIHADAVGLRLLVPDTEHDTQLAALLPLADYLLVRRRAIRPDQIANARRLRAVVSVGARVRFSEGDLARRNIAVVRLPRFTAMAVADLIICLMLAISRQVVKGHLGVVAAQYREHGPEPRATSETEFAFNWLGLPSMAPLYGRTLGLVGLGEIGALVAQRAAAFGMALIYFQRTRLDPAEERQLNIAYRPLDALFSEADFLSLQVPDSPQTRNLVSADAISRMKRGAYLINASRGRVVDEDALAKALLDGHLAGAALDVFRHEPLPADSPLIGIPNVVLTPHLGGGTADTLAREMDAAFRHIAAMRDNHDERHGIE